MCLNLRNCQLKITVCVCVCVVIYECYGNQKSKTYNTHTKTERNPNMKLKVVIKLQRKSTKEGRNKEELQKQPENNEQNGNKYIPINNYFKCKWTKCSNQKT